MFERWKERARRYHAGIAIDAEEDRKQLELNRQMEVEREAQASLERLLKIQAVDDTDKLYEQEVCVSSTASHHNTKPILLDAVVTPVLEESPNEINYDKLFHESRKERDAALLAARQWREATQTEK